MGRPKDLLNLTDIEVPVIALVNGPAFIHAEMGVMHDLVICTEDTVFQDLPHFPSGVVPGDGVHVIWQHILGPTRGRYFLITGQKIPAQEAKDVGIVNEVVPRAKLMDRAWELAEMITKNSNLVNRYSRLCLTRNYRKLLKEVSPATVCRWSCSPDRTNEGNDGLTLLDGRSLMLGECR